MKLAIKAVLPVLLVFTAGTAGATDDDTPVARPAAVAVTLDAGGIRNTDTYLSPLQYRGMHFRFGFERLRAARFNPGNWVCQINAGLTYSRPANPKGNNMMHALAADIGWQMMRRWENIPAEGFAVYAGSAFGLQGGVTYNPRNSNNVCSPQIRTDAGITGMAVYRTRLGSLPLTLRYQAVIPVVGGFYLPDYDQSFYEMYLGNWSGAANFGWWGNRFDMTNLLTADLHFGSAALRIGYRNEFSTVWENNISVRRKVHTLVIGAAWETLCIRPRHGIPPRVRLISAFY